MPFTPFHLGPVLFVGLLLFRWVNVPALLIGSVIADIEGFSAVFLGVNYPIHGYLHTSIGALFVGVFLALIVYGLRKKINPMMEYLHLPQDFTFLSVIIGSLFGTFSHVFLDSFLYTDLKPFLPSLYNPFLGLFSSRTIYSFCTVTLFLGVFYYLIKLSQSKKSL